MSAVQPTAAASGRPLPEPAQPIPRSPAAPDPADHVDWRRVGLFYGIALGGAAVVAAGLWALGGLGTPLAQLVVALVYMMTPIVAGLVVERRAGRGLLLGGEWRALRAGVGRTLGRVAGWSALVALAVFTVQVACALGFGALGVPGAGHWATDAEFTARLRAVQPTLPDGVVLNAWPLVAASAVQALLVGGTINGVLAFGEEYGWRGVLADLLRPLGVVRANLLIGVAWGLWHAPIIRLGHNYGAAWLPGIGLMVLWCVPLAFVLAWARERARSVAAPAVVHGAFNGFVGIFTLAIAGANPLVALPVGVLAPVPLAIVAATLWLAWPPGGRPQRP